MYRLLLTFFFLGSAILSFSQTVELTGRVWKITEDKMVGVGKHETLPAGTTLEFLSDGTWRASAPLRGATSGTWLRDGGDKMRMTFGEDSKSRKVKLLVLTTSELSFRLNDLKAGYTFTWKAQ